MLITMLDFWPRPFQAQRTVYKRVKAICTQYEWVCSIRSGVLYKKDP